MKYMQSGGFHKNPLMRLTLWFTLAFLCGFLATNVLLYFDRMDLTPASVVAYYNGSDEEFRPARSYQSMLEVTHSHAAMMAVVLLMLTHLAIFAPYSKAGKIALVLTTFLSGLVHEASGWLVRFVSADFALLKVLSFVTLQGSLLFLLVSLAHFLLRAAREESVDADSTGALQNDVPQPNPTDDFIPDSDPTYHHRNQPPL
jgi:hypothetical protein